MKLHHAQNRAEQRSARKMARPVHGLLRPLLLPVCFLLLLQVSECSRPSPSPADQITWTTTRCTTSCCCSMTRRAPPGRPPARRWRETGGPAPPPRHPRPRRRRRLRGPWVPSSLLRGRGRRATERWCERGCCCTPSQRGGFWQGQAWMGGRRRRASPTTIT